MIVIIVVPELFDEKCYARGPKRDVRIRLREILIFYQIQTIFNS